VASNPHPIRAARSGESSQQQEEQPQAGHAEQQRRLPQAPDSRLENSEYRAVDPGLQRPQVAHQHDRQKGTPELDGIPGARLQEGVPEESLVVLDAQPGNKGLARQEEENTRRRNEAARQTFIGVAHCRLELTG
jgi:hypothetical protein